MLQKKEKTCKYRNIKIVCGKRSRDRRNEGKKKNVS